MPSPHIPVVRALEFAAIAAAVETLFGAEVVDTVFKQHGFSIALLSEPDLQLPNVEYVRFLEACARESGKPLLGAMIGNSVAFAELGLFGRYVTSAPDLRTALNRASKGLKYHETGSHLTCSLRSNRLTLTYRPPTPKALGSWQQTDGAAAMILNLIRLYEGTGWRPEHIALPGATNGRRRQLERHFHTDISAARDSVRITGSVGAAHLDAATSTLHGQPLSRRELRQMISSRPPGSFAGTLRRLMRPLAWQGTFDMNRVAESIGVSPRTMQRRLAAERVDFSDLLSDTRRNFAEELLANTDMTMGNISVRLGYSSKQHFIRAYKGWTGVTPGRFRSSASKKRFLG